MHHPNEQHSKQRKNQRNNQQSDETGQANTLASGYNAAVLILRRLFPSFVGLCVCVAAAVASGQTSAPPTNAKPAPSSTVAPPPVAQPPVAQPPVSQGAASSTATSGSALATAARAIVSLERQGRPIGLGFVLAGDGRIIASLSAIGDGNQIDARYADGSVVGVKAGHSDRVWNIVLLVPQVGRWDTGLQASSADPLAEGMQLRTFSKRGRGVAATAVTLKGRAEFLGGDGAELHDAIEISTAIANADLGTPLVDTQGRALGVVSTACKPAEGKTGGACRSTAFGVPMNVLRQFLRSAPANAITPSPWLGIQGVGVSTPVGGVRVMHTHPGSPAAAIQLLDGQNGVANDVIIAVDGVPVHSAETLSDQVRSKSVGDSIQIIVLRSGKFHVLQTTLTAAPSSGQSSSNPVR